MKQVNLQGVQQDLYSQSEHATNFLNDVTNM